MPLVCSHSHHSLFICNLALPSPSPSYAFTPIVLSRPRSAPRLFLNPLRAPPPHPLVSSNPREGSPGSRGPRVPPSLLPDPARERTGKARCFTDVADYKENNSTGASSLRPRVCCLRA